jgi:hypothetical protein
MELQQLDLLLFALPILAAEYAHLWLQLTPMQLSLSRALERGRLYPDNRHGVL